MNAISRDDEEREKGVGADLRVERSGGVGDGWCVAVAVAIDDDAGWSRRIYALTCLGTNARRMRFPLCVSQ